MPATARPEKAEQTDPPRGWVTARPCPVCSKRGWCSVTIDGQVACCRRKEDGCYAAREDTNSTPYFLHRVENGRAQDWTEYRTAAAGRAPDRVVHNVYVSLLEALELEPRHRDQLLGRGLTDQEITDRGYRTLPRGGRRQLAEAVLAKLAGLPLIKAITRDQLLKTPGFYMDAGGQLSVAGPAGLLIPLCPGGRRCTAIKVRVDDPGPGPKYLYLSSTKYGGPGPGAPLHFPPRQWYRGEAVRLVEGELKADVATARTVVLSIGLPGCAAWRAGLAACQQWLCPTVRLAFDMDCLTNSVVAGNLLAAARAVQAAEALGGAHWTPRARA
jgi:hypothetical protein